MVAKLDDVPIPAKTWTRITDNVIASGRAINNGGFEATLSATADTTAPSTTKGGIRCFPGGGVFGDQTFQSLFPSIGTQGHYWVYCEYATVFSVSHGA